VTRGQRDIVSDLDLPLDDHRSLERGETGERSGAERANSKSEGRVPANRTDGATRLYRLRRVRVSAISAWVAAAWDEERAFGHGVLFLPLTMALGAIQWFSASNPPGLGVTAVLACLFCIAAIFARHARGVVPVVLIALAGFTSGQASAALETWRTTTVMLDSGVTTMITGRVVSREISGRNGYRFVVALQSTQAPVVRRPPSLVTLVVRTSATINAGDIITVRARLSPPSGPALRGLNDFGFDAFFKGIGAVGYAYGKPVVRSGIAEDHARETTVIDRVWQTIADLRQAIGVRIRATIPGDTGAIAAALVTAEERAISPAAIAALRNSGLGHVLAISGMNMVLAAGTLLVGLRTVLSLVPGLAHRVAIKKIAAAGALVMVCFYILISGGAVSAVRSWIMIVIMLVAVFFDRPSISLRNVAIAALLILAVDPSAVTGPGFQMSFAATLALVAGYARWRGRDVPDRTRRVSDVLESARSFLAALFFSSLIGGLSTMIYSAAHFNQLPAYGLLGNMLALPVISIVVMPAGLIAMLLMPLGLDTVPLIVMGYGLDVMMAVARLVSSFGGQVSTGLIPTTAFACIAVGGVVLSLLRTRLAFGGLLLVVVGLCIIVAAPRDRPALVIAEDGRLVAVMDGARPATNLSRPPAFIYTQWTRALRLETPSAPVDRADLAVPEPEGKKTEDATPSAGRKPHPAPFRRAAPQASLRRLIQEGTPGRFTCVPKQWCAMTSPQGWVVVTVADRRLVGAACNIASVVVTSVSVPFDSCRSGALLAGPKILKRRGALTITPDETAGALTDAAKTRGMRIEGTQDGLVRPWQRHRAYDWRLQRFTDDLPERRPDADLDEEAFPVEDS
jgi:ComEC/Rec2-related protein